MIMINHTLPSHFLGFLKQVIKHQISRAWTLLFSILVFQTILITIMVLKHNVLSACISSDLLLV